MLGTVPRAALLALALHMCLPLIWGSGARAAEAMPPALIAILDFKRVMRDSAASKDIRRQIEAHRKSFQADIKRAEGKLREEEESLKRQRATMAPDVFAKRRRAFEKKVIALQRKVQNRARALDNAHSRAMAELRKPVRKLISDLAKERGYNFIIDNRHIFIKIDGYDITPEVMRRLDEKVPKIMVPRPGK